MQIPYYRKKLVDPYSLPLDKDLKGYKIGNLIIASLKTGLIYLVTAAKSNKRVVLFQTVGAAHKAIKLLRNESGHIIPKDMRTGYKFHYWTCLYDEKKKKAYKVEHLGITDPKPEEYIYMTETDVDTILTKKETLTVVYTENRP